MILYIILIFTYLIGIGFTYPLLFMMITQDDFVEPDKDDKIITVVLSLCWFLSVPLLSFRLFLIYLFQKNKTISIIEKVNKIFPWYWGFYLQKRISIYLERRRIIRKNRRRFDI